MSRDEETEGEESDDYEIDETNADGRDCSRRV